MLIKQAIAVIVLSTGSAGASAQLANQVELRIEPSNRTLTVNAVLQRSTDALDPELRDFFAYLACFAPKPASFNLAAMNAVWGVPDPQAIASRLIDWGLLEPAREGRYQMHALLVLHAQTLLHA